MWQKLTAISLLAVSSFLIYGCDPAPEQNTPATAAQVESDEYANVGAEGFFTDLRRFVDVENIQQIGIPRERGRQDAALGRLNIRYEMIIGHHKDLINGSRILDFGSYDGRFTYAALDAGAEYVKGIEINQDYADQASLNMAELGVERERYDFIVADLLTYLKTLEAGSYDGAICAGIFYHITYHVELMRELERLDLDWVIMDSAVVQSEAPIVKWSLAPMRLEGIPSLSAIQFIAEQTGFTNEVVELPKNSSDGMFDYNGGNRYTLTLLRRAK
ncbi:MAG: class I SAM-dependent methyltransferase [Gammaproteobacteria bacterium]|jgi:hypothetical protein|nr:class I SAM-dependent methyltransferase [Gammaproteobacteria bacterium]MDP6616321.1 class I SAM-dependent methyltransferase [Gammaproteobacteria bacterium]